MNKIVFMGTSDFGIPTLKNLIKFHDVELVITQPDRANRRGKKIEFNEIKKLAIENNIEVFQPEDINSEESIKKISKINPDYIVVVAYGQFIKKELRDLAKKNIINLHASLLPKYRGAAPVQRSIMDREEYTGNSIMQVSKGMDTGDIFLQNKIKIGDKKLPEIWDELSISGGDLMLEYINKNNNGEIEPISQDENLATYAKKISKEDGYLDFKDVDIEFGKINGLYPKPGASFLYEDIRVKAMGGKIISHEKDKNYEIGKIIDVNDEGIKVNCDNGVLLITDVQFPSKKEMKVRDYIKGNNIEKTILR